MREGCLGVVAACLLREGLRGVLPCRLVDTKWKKGCGDSMLKPRLLMARGVPVSGDLRVFFRLTGRRKVLVLTAVV